MIRIITALILAVGLVSCSTSDLWDAGSRVLENYDISIGEKKDGGMVIVEDSAVVNLEPTYAVISLDSLVPYREYHYTNGETWLWIYMTNESIIVEGGALDTTVKTYIYRRED